MREGMFAIYEYTNPEWTSGRKFYDVVEIQILPEYKFPNGIVYPIHEAFPKERTWGDKGWSFSKLEDAKKKFRELTRKK